MRRVYMSLIFFAVLFGSFASMIALQHVVTNIAEPDVLPGKK
jgi:hypothetical protein